MDPGLLLGNDPAQRWDPSGIEEPKHGTQDSGPIS